MFYQVDIVYIDADSVYLYRWQYNSSDASSQGVCHLLIWNADDELLICVLNKDTAERELERQTDRQTDV